MSEINKRIISSLAIISLLIISFNNKTLFSLLLLFIFYQLFHEFLNIFRKISNFKKNIIVFIVLTILIYLIALIILIWFIIIHNFNDRLLYLYVIILVCMSTDVGGFVFGKLFKGKIN